MRSPSNLDKIKYVPLESGMLRCRIFCKILLKIKCFSHQKMTIKIKCRSTKKIDLGQGARQPPSSAWVILRGQHPHSCSRPHSCSGKCPSRGPWPRGDGTVVGLGTISIELAGVVCAVRCAGPVHGSRPPLPPRAGTPTEGRKVLRVQLGQTPRSAS